MSNTNGHQSLTDEQITAIAELRSAVKCLKEVFTPNTQREELSGSAVSLLGTIAMRAGLEKETNPYNTLQFLEKRVNEMLRIEAELDDLGYRSLKDALRDVKRIKERERKIEATAGRFGYNTLEKFVTGYKRECLRRGDSGSNYKETPFSGLTEEEWEEEVKRILAGLT